MRRIETADFVDVEMKDEDIDNDQRHQETWHRHAKKGDPRQHRIDPAILSRRRDNAEADAENGGQDVAGQRQRQRAWQSLGNDVGNRLVVVEALTEISVEDDPLHPVEILHGKRIVQAVGLAIGLGLAVGLFKGCTTLIDRLRANVIAIVARRGLDDGEGHDAEHKQQHQSRHDPVEEKSYHIVPASLFCSNRHPEENRVAGSRGWRAAHFCKSRRDACGCQPLTGPSPPSSPGSVSGNSW